MMVRRSDGASPAPPPWPSVLREPDRLVVIMASLDDPLVLQVCLDQEVVRTGTIVQMTASCLHGHMTRPGRHKTQDHRTNEVI